jgi:hypothetical protein
MFEILTRFMVVFFLAKDVSALLAGETTGVLLSSALKLATQVHDL